MSEETTTTTTTSADAGTKDAAYLENEMKSAFKDRDAAKKRAKELESRLKELENRVMTDEQIREHQELLEERAKRTGDVNKVNEQWQTRFAQQNEAHTKAIAERDERVAKEISKRHAKAVKAEFASATDWFGGHENTKAVLDVAMAIDVLGKYVSVEDNDDGEEFIAVKDPRGRVILGPDGNPAPFTVAIGELINALPNKDRILRGSGKAGSGNAGGANGGHGDRNLNRLTPADFNDPKVRAAIKDQQAAAGGLVFGSAWDRARK